MKTGTKVLIGSGMLGAGTLGYYFWKRAQSLPLLTLASEQPTVSKKIIESLPPLTKAIPTEAQQAQTAKIVAMLNQDTPIVKEVLTVKPVATMANKAVYMQPAITNMIYGISKSQPQPGSLSGNASAIVSSGAATAATLYAVAAGAQAVPIVGQVLGAVALVAGFLANSYAKSKAIKAQANDVDVANRLLTIQNAELDDNISKSHAQVNAINSEIARLGLSGVQLNGLSDFLKKTFTPAKYQQGILNDKVEQNKQLQASAEQKISILESIDAELKQVYDKLTGGKNLQKGLLIGGGVAAGITVLYFLNDHFKWIKL